MGFQLLKKSADLGSASSAFTLGCIYSDEKNDLFDLEKAFEYFHDSANKWHPDSQKCLALAYFEGKGTECNYQEAVKWLILSERLEAQNTQPIREYFEAHISSVDFEFGTKLANEIFNQI
jgi:TPR repeat protein